jgi:GDP-4-dehydro-6-deoxy-D-mannose reductase
MTSAVLVTGASGLVGGEVVRALGGGPWTVVATGRSASGTEPSRPCDLAAPEEVLALVDAVRPQAIVHAAGGTSPDRHELYRRNVLTTVHLLEAAARLAPRPYCIVLGSAAEYGDGGGEPIRESAPLAPVSEYGRAKVAQTTLAEAVARARDLPLTVLRPFNVVSPRLSAATPLGNLRRQLLDGAGPERTVACGRLDVVRDFVPLPAVAEVVRLLLLRPAPGRALNVCSGVGIALGELLTAMAERLGVALQIAVREDLLAIPAAPRVVGDPTALREATGYAIDSAPRPLAAHLLDEGALSRAGSVEPQAPPKSSSS